MDNPWQNLLFKGSTKHSFREAIESRRSEATTGHGGYHGQTVVAAMAVVAISPTGMLRFHAAVRFPTRFSSF